MQPLGLRISPYSVRMRENADKNKGITLNMNTFQAVVARNGESFGLLLFIIFRKKISYL